MDDLLFGVIKRQTPNWVRDLGKGMRYKRREARVLWSSIANMLFRHVINGCFVPAVSVASVSFSWSLGWRVPLMPGLTLMYRAL